MTIRLLSKKKKMSLDFKIKFFQLRNGKNESNMALRLWKSAGSYSRQLTYKENISN